MRTYQIDYYALKRDQTQDLEDFVEGENILEALQNFYKKGIVHKRVTGVFELPAGHEKSNFKFK